MSMTIIEKSWRSTPAGQRSARGRSSSTTSTWRCRQDLGFIFSPDLAMPKHVHDPDFIPNNAEPMAVFTGKVANQFAFERPDV